MSASPRQRPSSQSAQTPPLSPPISSSLRGAHEHSYQQHPYMPDDDHIDPRNDYAYYPRSNLLQKPDAILETEEEVYAYTSNIREYIDGVSIHSQESDRPWNPPDADVVSECSGISRPTMISPGQDDHLMSTSNAATMAVDQHDCFPPTTDMQQRAQIRMDANNGETRVIYAGDVSYMNKTDSGRLLLPKKSKRIFMILTNTCLLHFKTSAKARASGVALYQPKPEPTLYGSDRTLAHLVDIYGVHNVASGSGAATAASGQPHIIRIEHLHPQTKQPLAFTIALESAAEKYQWLKAIRDAVAVHLPAIMTTTSAERYAVAERIAKQNDRRNDDYIVHKVIYKEKRVKAASDAKSSNNDTVKEIYLVVLFALGKFSMYIMPLNGAYGMLDDTYLKTVERDRHGLLAIQHIDWDGKDDTIKILVRQPGKPSRQLALVSTFAESIVQHLRQAIRALVPIPLCTVSLPTKTLKTPITPLRLLQANGQDDDDGQKAQFEHVLQAYCAALNLNKARFEFDFTGSPNGKVFTLRGPNEINQTPHVYSKYELLAILKCLQACSFIDTVCLADHSLEELEQWTPMKDDAWALARRSNVPKLENDTVLAYELYALLVTSPRLTKLDLTGCYIGHGNFKRPTSALLAIGKALRQVTPNVARIDRLCLGKNRMFGIDLQALMTGLETQKHGLRQLDVHDCRLGQQQMEFLVSSLLLIRPERLQYLDLSSSHTPIAVSDGLLENLFQRCGKLQVVNLRGHAEAPLEALLSLRRPGESQLNRGSLATLASLATTTSRIVRLDLSGSKHLDINLLLLWMDNVSFNSVQVLHLDDCGLNGGHVRDLLVGITQSGNRDLHLSLAGNPLLKDVVHLPKLSSAFLKGDGPRSLSLARIEWEDSTLRELFECLRENQTIESLDLSDTSLVDDLSADTERMLSSVFERNTVLKVLNMGYTLPVKQPVRRQSANIGRLVIRALDGLRNNVSLEYLKLTGLLLGDAGAKALARLLLRNHTLLGLSIDGNEITIDGFRELATIISNESSIIDLPRPRSDLRHQIAVLQDVIMGSTQNENEMQWFIIHSTSSSESKRTKAQMQMQMQARQHAEISLRQIVSVVDILMEAVERNRKTYQEQEQRTMAMQLQAQTAAQELAVAQLRLQGAGNVLQGRPLPGATLSAVGASMGTPAVSVISHHSNSDNSSRSSRASRGSDISTSGSSDVLARQKHQRHQASLRARGNNLASYSSLERAAGNTDSVYSTASTDSMYAPLQKAARLHIMPMSSTPPPASPPPSTPPPPTPSFSAPPQRPLLESKIARTSSVSSIAVESSSLQYTLAQRSMSEGGSASRAQFGDIIDQRPSNSLRMPNHNRVPASDRAAALRQRLLSNNEERAYMTDDTDTKDLSPPSPVDHPGFIDDFGIIVTNQAPGIARQAPDSPYPSIDKVWRPNSIASTLTRGSSLDEDKICQDISNRTWTVDH
ncbi:hypothetical protein BCR43DRAFT_510122 [Syncephalastrum racemosum]|uniref:PH domain-containing protein n=1 Tax=Syncephalastrum racemosum TaxID=13706 RepID=A0A1X2HTW5_SYNRA|nr:hypothetical protein BCR43DRAFT_510122 [Syncephalastrum racemosum]